jgi:hypothetical protein
MLEQGRRRRERRGNGFNGCNRLGAGALARKVLEGEESAEANGEGRLFGAEALAEGSDGGAAGCAFVFCWGGHIESCAVVMGSLQLGHGGEGGCSGTRGEKKFWRGSGLITISGIAREVDGPLTLKFGNGYNRVKHMS